MARHSANKPSTKNKNRIFGRGKKPPALSNQLYFNITTETQSLVSFYHSVAQRACRLFAAEAPCPPITSTLSPRHVKTVPISCRIHLLHRPLTDSILFSLNPYDMSKEVKRSGGKEAEGKTKMKKITMVPRARVGRRVRKTKEREK